MFNKYCTMITSRHYSLCIGSRSHRSFALICFLIVFVELCLLIDHSVAQSGPQNHAKLTTNKPSPSAVTTATARSPKNAPLMAPAPSTTLTPPATSSKPRPSSDDIDVTGFCNDPGKPMRSQINPVQLTYTDGETVVYTCDQFISLKQHRKCVHGKWIGDTPICGEAFRENDMTTARYFDRDTGRLTAEYNVTGHLDTFEKFGNSFIAERYFVPARGRNASNYKVDIYIEKPAMLQMVRVSWSVVNHLTDERLAHSNFTVDRVTVSPFRECTKVSNNSVSPWHFNSTRFDFWFFCRSKSPADFNKELHQKSRLLTFETSANTPVDIDLATFILAEQYSNSNNLSDPICGLPEVPVGLEARVVNDQSNYVFTCAKNFKRIDNFGGQFHMRKCGYDMRWHGQLPECYPTKTCSKFHLASKNFLVEVFKYDRIYYPKENEWLPIPGSRAFFRCKDETHIFVGKEIRICEEDGEWSNSMPNCLVSVTSDPGLRANTILIIVLATLIVTFILSSCTIYFFLKLRTSQKNAQSQNQLELNEAAYYASSGLDPIAGKLIDDTYEQLEPFEARYASVNSYHPGVHNGAAHNPDPILVKTSPFENNSRNASYTCIQDYNTGYPVPAPRKLSSSVKPTENEYYDDTIMDSPVETYQDSYQIMRKP